MDTNVLPELYLNIARLTPIGKRTKIKIQMSLTLGEKLRQAREERGMSISEVAEQTRISALYIESIENDDYRPLPGGIFNKGFVKSYAKTLGLDEQEALQDYAAVLAQQGGDVNDDPKTYRPEVLTDERSGWGMFPTLIFAAAIVGLIVWGAMAFLNYYNSEKSPAVANVNNNADSANLNAAPTPTPTPTPISINEAKIQVKPVSAEVWVSATVDGKKTSGIIKSDDKKVYEPKEDFKLSYAREQAQNVQLTINGKQIKLPSEPASGSTFDILITKENINQIYQSGEISNAS